MLALIRARQYNEEDIPEGIFPKRQVVGTSITTATLGTTQAVTITQTTAITVSMSLVESIPTTILSITTPTITLPTTTETTPTTTAAQPPSTTSITTPTATPTTTTSTTSTTSPTSQTAATSSPLAVTSSDVVVVGSTTINRSSLTGATTITSALVGLETNAYVTTSYYTSNGQVYSSVYTTSRVVSSTTGYATATIEPALNSDGSGSGGSMSPHSSAIIGGVVGGVGGLILLGGLAFVAWRLWGKKKNGTKLPQDDYYGGHEEVQQTNSGDGLERYRTPGRPNQQPAMSVNASSNF